jgi:hypothetical protein
MKRTRTLPPDVYDALELSAEVYGGIGQPWLYDYNTPADLTGQHAPCCIYGHACHVGSVDIIGMLEKAGATGQGSDRAVRAINRRKRRDEHARVSFADWCAELNVVRGDR